MLAAYHVLLFFLFWFCFEVNYLRESVCEESYLVIFVVVGKKGFG